jgi:hypothetical protein
VRATAGVAWPRGAHPGRACNRVGRQGVWCVGRPAVSAGRTAMLGFVQREAERGRSRRAARRRRAGAGCRAVHNRGTGVAGGVTQGGAPLRGSWHAAQRGTGGDLTQRVGAGRPALCTHDAGATREGREGPVQRRGRLKGPTGPAARADAGAPRRARTAGGLLWLTGRQYRLCDPPLRSARAAPGALLGLRSEEPHWQV